MSDPVITVGLRGHSWMPQWKCPHCDYTVKIAACRDIIAGLRGAIALHNAVEHGGPGKVWSSPEVWPKTS